MLLRSVAINSLIFDSSIFFFDIIPNLLIVLNVIKFLFSISFLIELLSEITEKYSLVLILFDSSISSITNISKFLFKLSVSES